MKILLVGEYSRSHNSLKEGLLELGHEVVIVATGDYFKNYPADIKLKRRLERGLGRKFKIAIFKLTGMDLASWLLKRQFFARKRKFQNYDVVQLINENAIGLSPSDEKQVIDYLYRHNKRIFLLSGGTDHISVKYASQGKFRYSIYTPFEEKKAPRKTFIPMLRYLQPNFIALHQFVYKRIAGVIASDMDYHFPLLGHSLYLGMAPNAINIDKFDYIPPNLDEKIVIFHGINDGNYYKKGNDIFEAALALIAEKFADKIKIITVRSVPYAKYITLFDKAHILLDQVYAYDQGYNALEAMAKGKVVFTGAEKEWCEYYHIEEDTVAINALPDAQKIAEKLEWLIKNPEKITEISKNARKFVEDEHHYIESAKKYIQKWESVD